jgi:septin family protein
MGTAQSRYQIPSPQIQFRVLVVGRANAGKTSILQRVCETTNSLTIYRGEEEVRAIVQAFLYESNLTADQVTLNPSMDVSNDGTSRWLPLK